MEQNFIKRKGLRTYTKSSQKANNTLLDEGKSKKPSAKVPLSTKDAIKYLLEGTLRLRVCRYCLGVTSELSELDEILVIGIHGSTHEVTIRDMVASFHPYKVNEDTNFPNKICTDCVNHSINCYLFAQKCEQSERALRNCFDDMYEKIDKLDSLEPIKKRGKRKRNPNYNRLYTEHNNVINYAEPIINIVNIDNFPIPSNEISELECQKCWQVLPNMESLVNHEMSHPKTMWYNCKLCGKSFIKRYLLKRHLKEHHLLANEDNIQVNMEDFKCNKCGSLSITLGDHLQHMEKHKFKIMLKGLMERKVDDLCSICLEKGSRLSNLDDIISLYGGYPGLIGDRSIHNIVNATIPEQNSYKYRELILSNPVAILKIMQKQQIESKMVEKIKMTFEFSKPILNEIYLGLDNCLIEYDFAKPLLVNPFQLKNKDFNKIAEANLNINNIEVIRTEYKKNNSSATDDKNNDLIKIIQSCKLCWIFKKPTCKDCLNASKKNFKETCTFGKYTLCNDNNTPIINSNTNKKENCDLCWIFRNLGKCDTCKFTMGISGSETTKININEQKQPNNLLLMPKMEWKCNICLTINKNTCKCICCDKHNDSIEKMPVSIQNYTFLNKCNDSYINNVKEFKNTNDILKTVQEALPKSVSEFKYDLNFNKYPKIEQNAVNIYKAQNNNLTKVDNNFINEDVSMDIEITPNFFDDQIKNNSIEAMDFEENDTLLNNQQRMRNFTQHSSKSVDFSYRPGFLNTRRAKRPLRRMATPFQK